MRRRRKEEERLQTQIAPMIDCVFLLLIYFMVGSSLEKQEADLAFQLPGVVEQAEPLEMPDEQRIEIQASGQVVVNDYAYDSPGARRLSQLTQMLRRFREACEAARVEAMVTIEPAPETTHQAIVRVMDACAAAGLTAVSFAVESE